MKSIFILFSCFLLHGKAFSQDILYVITDAANIREKPQLNAKVLGTLKLGDSVMVTDYSTHKSTATIDGIKKTATWVEIIFKNKEVAWVFGGALCQQVIDYKSVRNRMALLEKKKIQDLDQLVKDSVLTFGGSFTTFKAQNGEKISLRFSVCDTDDQKADGSLVNEIYKNTSNPHIIEVVTSRVAFEAVAYVDLKRGKKFTFTEHLYTCETSSLSPDGKRIAGKLVASEKPTFVVFDFDVLGKPIYQTILNSHEIDYQWISNKEIHIFNKGTNIKKVLFIP